jgi:hypothetical protein
LSSWLLDIGARNEPLEAILKLLKTGEDEDIPPLVPDEYSEHAFETVAARPRFGAAGCGASVPYAKL